MSLEFTDITCYLNTNPDLKLTDLKGKVKHVYFLTCTCINYINTVPYADDWYQKKCRWGFHNYWHSQSWVWFRKWYDNSKEAVYDYDTEFPGLQDNNYGI